jgi:peptidoglycan hydrolase-like protein with peptidoglycan-binding domain
MFKKLTLLLLVGVFVFSLSGCATCRKKNNMETQGLKNQISVLESQVQAKDEEINSLKESLSRAQEEKIVSPGKGFGNKGVVSRSNGRPNVKQIQIALKNAGYNPGAIDGKKGKQTREAIKSFQKDNKLNADGKVGKETWDLLKKYLETKVK